jgi:vancomycin resistance protein YoaR
LADVPPAVSAEAALKAKTLARTAIANPVNVNAGNITATIDSADIADALTFTQEGGQLVPVLDGAILHKSIAADLKAVETPGRDATFEIVRGEPVVVPSQVGSGIADDELAAQVETVIGNTPPNRTVTVSMGTRDPKLTTEQAQQLGITQKISSFTQEFPYAAYRVQNIGEAARRINGTLLMPGETFSMNDTIKERTIANGYTVGFVIGAGGVFAEELGGGVSAATTTMWTAAFFAGMERTFTQAHSIYISRYQAGLEATVAWGSFDMKFTNNTPNAVFITTKMTDTSMKATFWGTPTYDEIKAEFGAKYNVRPYPTIYDKSKKCLGQGGMEGFSIDVDRVFYKDGAEVNRETITTNYRTSPKVICGKNPDKDPIKPIKPGKPGANPSASPTPAPSGDQAAPEPQS